MFSKGASGVVPETPDSDFRFYCNYGARWIYKPEGVPHTREYLQAHVAVSCQVPLEDVIVIDHPQMHDQLRWSTFVRKRKGGLCESL